jgi:hypothetical protein
MGTQRIEIPFKPGGGQIIKETSGLANGDVVVFAFTTCGEDDDPPFNNDWVKEGNFFLTADPGNNAKFVGVLTGPGLPVGPGVSEKSGSGQSSISWQFDKDPNKANAIVLKPDTEYLVTVTISQDKCPGLNGKLNAGPKHD